MRWRETVLALHEAGAPRFVEVGPGKVLARMGKRILKGVPFETPAEDLSMPSAALPPELHQIAREATRNGRPPGARRARRPILGLGHYLPTEVVPNGQIADRIGVDDALDRQAHRHPLAPPRRGRTSALTDFAVVRRPPRAAGRGRRRRSTSTSCSSRR